MRPLSQTPVTPPHTPPPKKKKNPKKEGSLKDNDEEGEFD
jgi:hypothetical protein